MRTGQVWFPENRSHITFWLVSFGFGWSRFMLTLYTMHAELKHKAGLLWADWRNLELSFYYPCHGFQCYLFYRVAEQTLITLFALCPYFFLLFYKCIARWWVAGLQHTVEKDLDFTFYAVRANVYRQSNEARIRFQYKDAKAVIWLYFRIKPNATMASLGSPAGFELKNPFLD